MITSPRHDRLDVDLGERRHAAVAIVVVDSDAEVHGVDTQPAGSGLVADIPGAEGFALTGRVDGTAGGPAVLLTVRDMFTRRAVAAVIIVFVSLVGLAAAPSGAAPGDGPDYGPPAHARALVRTDAGWVRGVAEDDHVTFSGIPYAARPVRERRWAPPAPVTPWAGVRDAAAPGSICPQVLFGEVAGDEDCLYLNVTSPLGRGSSIHGGRRPVVVWLHGGGFTSRAGSEYGGVRLATGGDVVVVTLDYRLGAPGFLSSPPPHA